MKHLKKTTENNLENINSENGLDGWNDRLDKNLEADDHNDLQADERAKKFSEKFTGNSQSEEIR